MLLEYHIFSTAWYSGRRAVPFRGVQVYKSHSQVVGARVMRIAADMYGKSDVENGLPYGADSCMDVRWALQASVGSGTLNTAETNSYGSDFGPRKLCPAA